MDAFIRQGYLGGKLSALFSGPLAAWVQPDHKVEEAQSGLAARNESSHSVCRADVPRELAEQVYEGEWLLRYVLAGLNAEESGSATDR